MKKYQYRLGDLIERVIDNRGKTPPYQNEGIPIIEVASIAKNNRHPDYKKVNKYVNTETYKSWFRSGHPQNGDVLVSTVGQIGKVSIMDETVACIAQNIVALRVKKELIVPDFLYYYLIRDSVQDFLQAMNIGSAQPSIKVPHLLDLTVDIPTIETQKKIVGILKSLDDKIELNLKMNETLEEMAMTLYRHWFANYDQASEFVTFNDLIEVNPKISVKKGTLVKFLEMKYLPDHSMSVKDYNIQIKEFSSGVKFQMNDILFARITPCLENGKTAFVDFLNPDEVAAGSTEFLVFRAREGVCPQYVYCLSRDPKFREFAKQSMVGTSGRQRVQKDALLQYEIPLPHPDYMRKFDILTKNYFSQIRSNILEIQALEQIRDYLLPRLLSGEIDVSQAEKQAEEVL